MGGRGTAAAVRQLQHRQHGRAAAERQQEHGQHEQGSWCATPPVWAPLRIRPLSAAPACLYICLQLHYTTSTAPKTMECHHLTCQRAYRLQLGHFREESSLSLCVHPEGQGGWGVGVGVECGVRVAAEQRVVSVGEVVSVEEERSSNSFPSCSGRGPRGLSALQVASSAQHLPALPRPALHPPASLPARPA